MCASVHVYMWDVRVHTCMCSYMYVHVRVCIFARVYVHACVHAHLHAQVHVGVCMCVCLNNGGARFHDFIHRQCLIKLGR
jgi:hypothetical protein